MKQLLIIVAAAALLAMPASLSAQEDLWNMRTSPENVEKAYTFFKSQYQSSPTYESAWKFARAAHYYASITVPEVQAEKRKAIFEEGKIAAEKARELNPNGVEGNYYFGSCLGSWAESNGVLSSLFAVNDLLAAVNTAVKINESFDKAFPLVARGRIYAKAPGWPLSIGDKGKADADYKRALQLAPMNRVAHRFYAEMLLDENRKDEARAIIDRGLAIPQDATNTMQERIEIGKLEDLKKRL